MRTIAVFFWASILSGCQGQVRSISPTKGRVVGGGCDGCELMYIGMPSDIRSVDTSAGWSEKGRKLLVTGVVYAPDGKAPAPGVILYYWQTDNNGYYSPAAGQDERAKRHGHLRGWVKTGRDGRYSIHTVRPAPYPDEDIPAHIHFSIKEPGIANEYYPDDINFDDDTLLIPYFKRYPPERRGGSGVVRVYDRGGVQIAERNIILGLNIPDHPGAPAQVKDPG